MAALYASGNSSDDIYKIFKNYCKEIKYWDFKNIINIIKDIIKNKNNYEKKDENIKYIYDINIGKAVRASCSYPGIFAPTEFENIKLIDGGIRENTPWKELKNCGA